MVFIIAGRPRSGTTILQRLCDGHPEIAMTNEFGNFLYLDQSLGEHALNLFRRWKRVQGKWAFDVSYASEKKLLAYKNLFFVLKYIYFLSGNHWGQVTVKSIEIAYQKLFPQSKLIGDKLPHYLLQMDRFVTQDNLKRLVIYRDCRDVTSSFLKQVRTTWKGADWVQQLDSAEKIAKSWVRDIQIMEAFSDKLIILQYEALMRQPKIELARVSAALGIDSAGFPIDMINPSSIGKYKQGLSSEELEIVMGIAGPTMERLGYLL